MKVYNKLELMPFNMKESQKYSHITSTCTTGSTGDIVDENVNSLGALANIPSDHLEMKPLVSRTIHTY